MLLNTSFRWPRGEKESFSASADGICLGNLPHSLEKVWCAILNNMRSNKKWTTAVRIGEDTKGIQMTLMRQERYITLQNIITLNLNG